MYSCRERTGRKVGLTRLDSIAEPEESKGQITPELSRTSMIKTGKTVYESPDPSDGTRILVMTLWPRGVKRERIDEWRKELGCSRSLIQDWKSGRISWEELRDRYFDEMKSPEKRAMIRQLAQRAEKGTITLLCTDKDETRCHRSLLKELIEISGASG